MAAQHGTSSWLRYVWVGLIVVGVLLSVRIMLLPATDGRLLLHFAHRLTGTIKPPLEMFGLSERRKLAKELSALSFVDESYECALDVSSLCASVAHEYLCEALQDGIAGGATSLSSADLHVVVRPNWNWLQAAAIVEAYEVVVNKSSTSPEVIGARSAVRDFMAARHTAASAPKLPAGLVATRGPHRRYTSARLCTAGLKDATSHARFSDLAEFRSALFALQHDSRTRAVADDPYHAVSNLIIGTNKLCGIPATGEQVFNPHFDVTHNFILGKRNVGQMLRKMNLELQQTREDALLDAFTLGSVAGNRAAEQALLSKLTVWRPLSIRQPEQTAVMALRAMIRPTLLCVTLTTYDTIELALLQHALWGRNCDEHLILALPVESAAGASDGKVEGEDGDSHRTTRQSKRTTMPENIDAMAAAVGMRRYNVIDLDPQQLFEPAEKHNRWQRLRAAASFLDKWPFQKSFTYFLITDETVYAVPENIYSLTLQPEVYYLNAFGTPLLLGNRMILEKERVPYIAASGGILLNRFALDLYIAMHNSVECAFDAATNAEDVMLAHCLALFGVIPRDTSDEAGQDRFHIMPPSWLIRLALAPESSWWYTQYRPRPLKVMAGNVFLSLSSSSVSFGGINTLAKALRIHDAIWNL